jgi:hypothetical protein
MAFSDFPAPEPDRVFWSAAQFIAYLHSYVAYFDIAPLFHFHTLVRSVVKEEDASAPMGHVYRVTLADNHTNHRHRKEPEERVETFDAVVIATGVNRSPKVPDFAGRDAFEANGGRVVHSSDYTNAAPYTGKRVVLVGAGETGADVIKEVSDVALEASLSLRRGVSVATKYPMRSIHTNDAFHARAHYYSHPALTSYLFGGLNKKISTMTDVDPVFAMIGRLNMEAGGGEVDDCEHNRRNTISLSLCLCLCLSLSLFAHVTFSYTNSHRTHTELLLHLQMYRYVPVDHQERDLCGGARHGKVRETKRHCASHRNGPRVLRQRRQRRGGCGHLQYRVHPWALVGARHRGGRHGEHGRHERQGRSSERERADDSYNPRQHT